MFCTHLRINIIVVIQKRRDQANDTANEKNRTGVCAIRIQVKQTSCYKRNIINQKIKNIINDFIGAGK